MNQSQDHVKDFQEKVENAISQAQAKLADLRDNSKDMIDDFQEKAQSTIEDAKQKFEEFAAELKEKSIDKKDDYQEKVENAINDAQLKIEELSEEIKEKSKDRLGDFQKKAEDTMNAAQAKVEDIKNKTKVKLEDFRDRAEETRNGLTEKLSKKPGGILADSANGFIEISPDVVATIAGVAAGEIPGVANMSGGVRGNIAEILGRTNLAKGVKVELAGDEAIIDLYIVVEYGAMINQVTKQIQKAVKKAIEGITGLKCSTVNIFVEGITSPAQNDNSTADA